MSATEKPKPRRGNPSWPSGLPKSLAEIDNEAYRRAGMQPGRGALSWGRWGPDEARRQGQHELGLGLHPLEAVRAEIERAQHLPRQARIPKRKPRPHRHALEDEPLGGDEEDA